jgi:hypothetical protein
VVEAAAETAEAAREVETPEVDAATVGVEVTLTV